MMRLPSLHPHLKTYQHLSIGTTMNKKLIAFCAAASLGGLAHAQSSVQLAGLVDAYAGSMRMSGDAVRQAVVGSGGMTTSWFGFSGSEDLGGGLKANFALTSFFRADAGLQGRFTGDNLFSRDAWVGMSGGFGAFKVGRSMAPNFLPTILFNPYGDSFTVSPLVLHANVPLFNGTGWGSTTPADTGWSNLITYTTPSMGGLTANVHYQLGEQKTATTSGKKNAGINALYFGGPIALTAFYERAEVSNPNPAALASVKDNWMLGGSYDAGFLKAFATYGESETKTTRVTGKTGTLGASVPFGSGKFLAAWANTKMTGGAKRDTVSLGYDYAFSKRSDLYAVVMHDKITSFSSGTSYVLGLRHRF